MPFINEGKALLKNLDQFKEYSSQAIPTEKQMSSHAMDLAVCTIFVFFSVVQ